MKSLCTAALAAGLCLCGPAVAWTLDGDKSAISYVTIKNAATAEPNLLTGLSGSVDDDGAARIDIALASVETYVDIRNERMREFLFRVSEHPVASLTARLDLDKLSMLDEGATTDTEFDVTIAANGTETDYPVIAAVTRVGANRVLVSARQPVIVYADDLGYDEGVAKLQEIAGLESIQLTVPVSFNLVFDR